MRQLHLKPWWEEEVAWIEKHANSKEKMQAFKAYCDMQMHFAALDGFPDLAKRIKEAKDKAQ